MSTNVPAIPSPTQLPQDCIESNPDISGIGVRTAIYIQNFIAPLLALAAFHDRKVEWKELELVEAESLSILLTACALLLSAVVQSVTIGMSTYHALIILNLAWMNNTNTFVYAILFRYQGVKPLRYFRNKLRTLPTRRKAIPLLVGSFHLSFMAGFGLWFWATVDKFGAGAQCPQAPIRLSVLGHHIPATSTVLRRVSLAVYGIIAIPVLNVLLVAGIIWGSGDLMLRFLPPAAFFLPGYFWVTMLVVINVIFIVDTESMISRTKGFVKSGESQWTFGQTLALFLLVLPTRDILTSIVREQSQENRENLGSLGRILLRIQSLTRRETSDKSSPSPILPK